MLRRFVVALLVMGAVTFAPAVRGGEDRPFDLHELRLANGLRVVTDHNPRVPTVSVVVRYDVGTSMDPVGRAGLAELTMWLMARRSQHVREGDFVAQLERAGATWQYNSYEDAIIFSAEVPINALELAFWLLSDQMGFFVPALDQAAIDDRRTMMKNERATMANRKGALAEKLARDELYPEGHPYRQTIASPDDIQLGGVTVKEVEAFAKRWFVPSNAVLVVAGDVTRDQVAGLANKYFAPIEGGAAPPHVVPPPVTLAGQTVLEVAAPVQLTTVTIDWPTPRHYAPGDADLDVVAGVLYGTRVAKFNYELATRRKVASSVSATQRSAMLASVFEIVATVEAGRQPQEVIDAIDDVLRGLVATDPTTDQLKGAVTAVLIPRIYGLESNVTRAFRYAGWVFAQGTADYVKQDFMRYAQINAASVRAAARAYLPLDRRVITILEPDATAPLIGVLRRRDVKKGAP